VTPGTWIVAVVVLCIVAALLPVRRKCLDWFLAVSWRRWAVRAAFLTIPAAATIAAVGDSMDVIT
jgi:hypothetical protein